MRQEHQPVLIHEVLEGMTIKPKGCYVDTTFGRGGHSRAILARLAKEGRLIAFDKDLDAIATAKSIDDPRFEIIHASFAELKNELVKRDCWGHIDGILFDLGVSSPQLDKAERGFSFMQEGPLDMRMNAAQSLTAAKWLNETSETDIARVLWRYGEEKMARPLAKAIVAAREQEPFVTTQQLVKVICKIIPRHVRTKHPATLTFQAIRIVVNDELAEIEAALPQALEALAIGGRLSVISFHSLEDRLVKQFIQLHSQSQIPAKVPLKESEVKVRLRKVGGLIKPSTAEMELNARARSARLRIAEKIA